MGFDKKAFWCYNSGMVRTALTGDGRQGWATVLYVDKLWITFGDGFGDGGPRQERLTVDKPVNNVIHNLFTFYFDLG